MDRRTTLQGSEWISEYYRYNDLEARSREFQSRVADMLGKELGRDLRKDRERADQLLSALGLTGRDKEREALLVRLIDAVPDDVQYRRYLGWQLLEQKRAGEALAQFDAILEKALGWERLNATQGRAWALSALGRAREALESLDRALATPGASEDETSEIEDCRKKIAEGTGRRAK
ncbi:MAG: hypothetical protein NTX64_09390 [Elusimicrobia bacterium]|nr:hypothetical protein [Elusimicrobiota bacterium]